MYYVYPSPIGDLFIGVKDEKLVSLSTKKPLDFIKKCPYKPVIGKICKFLDDYFSGLNPKIDFEFIIEGSDFKRRVYKELVKVPYGESITYKQLAERVFLGKPCAQAVGGAVGKNPVLIIIPCHRVLGTDGSLTGFSAGIEIKKYLLDLEKIKYKN